MKKNIVFPFIFVIAFFGIIQVAAQVKPSKNTEVSNEEKMVPLGVGLSLAVLREHPDENFEAAISDFSAGFPKFTADLKEVLALKTDTPPDQRRKVVEKTQESLRVKFNKSDNWQFNVGTSFGNLMSQALTDTSAGKESDGKLFRVELNNIRQLAASAPDDIPKDVLAKITSVGELYQDEDLSSLEGLRKILDGIMSVLDTVSPE